MGIVDEMEVQSCDYVYGPLHLYSILTVYSFLSLDRSMSLVCSCFLQIDRDLNVLSTTKTSNRIILKSHFQY